MKQTAVEWLESILKLTNVDLSYHKIVIQQAKEMEKEQSRKYAEFAVMCDRKELPILEFDGFIKL
jgi:hypothetical protein